MPVLPEVGLDQRVAGLDVAALLGLDDHRQRGPVLDRARRVVAFELAEDDVRRRRPACAAGGRAACCRRCRRASGNRAESVMAGGLDSIADPRRARHLKLIVIVAEHVLVHPSQTKTPPRGRGLVDVQRALLLWRCVCGTASLSRRPCPPLPWPRLPCPRPSPWLLLPCQPPWPCPPYRLLVGAALALVGLGFRLGVLFLGGLGRLLGSGRLAGRRRLVVLGRRLGVGLIGLHRRGSCRRCRGRRASMRAWQPRARRWRRRCDGAGVVTGADLAAAGAGAVAGVAGVTASPRAQVRHRAACRWLVPERVPPVRALPRPWPARPSWSRPPRAPWSCRSAMTPLSFIFSNVASPMPLTFFRSSIDLNGPLALR